MPVNWTPENDRKLLLGMIGNFTTSKEQADALALLVPGATAGAVYERIKKYRKEKKAFDDAASAPGSAAAANGGTADADNTTTAADDTASKPRGRRSKAEIEAANAAAVTTNNATTAETGEPAAPNKRGRGRPPKATPAVAMKGGMAVHGKKRKRGVVEDEEDEEEAGAAAKGKGVAVKKEGGSDGEREDPFEEGEMVDVD